MQLSNDTSDLTELQNEFPSIPFKIFTSDKDSFICCYACWFSNAESLVALWEQIQSFIAFSQKPKNHLAKWNVYIAIYCTEKLSKQDKYAIQNNKFFARKIVIDNSQISSTTDEALEWLRNELLGLDLNITETDLKASEVINSKFSDYILQNAPKQKSERIDFITTLINEMESL